MLGRMLRRQKLTITGGTVFKCRSCLATHHGNGNPEYSVLEAGIPI